MGMQLYNERRFAEAAIMFDRSTKFTPRQYVQEVRVVGVPPTHLKLLAMDSRSCHCVSFLAAEAARCLILPHSSHCPVSSTHVPALLCSTIVPAPQMYGKDKGGPMLRARCQKFAKDPPPENWDPSDYGAI